ncbi:MAG: hypothetical protein U9N42_10270 [Campylobacterota bacterium]|nr:hypothetical protein [Campylobacterota bacterium]
MNKANDTNATSHHINTSAAPAELVQKASQGDKKSFDTLCKAIFSRTFEMFSNKNSADMLKSIVLSKLVENPNYIDELAKKYGYNIEYISTNPDNIGRKIGEKTIIKQPSSRSLKKNGYAKGNIFVYDPYSAHGAFNDVEYTKVWRGVHELAHALTETLMQSRYGDSKRFGALSFDIKNPYNKNDKKIYSGLSLLNAQRAVEWEDVAFRTQLKLLDEMGIKVDINEAINDFNIVESDTLIRALTGDFSDPADYGVMPRNDGAMIDIKDVLELLEHQEKENAKYLRRDVTLGIDLSTWKKISDQELDDALHNANVNQA